MRVTELKPFGIVIEDVSINAMDSARIETVRDLVCQHKVAVLRNQPANDGSFARFLGSLGEVMFTAGETAVPGAPTLNIVSNMGRDRPPRSVFHTDTSYVERPPAFTALRAVTVPRAGGETLFSDQTRVLHDLPTKDRDWLEGRSLHHAYTAKDCAEVAHWHPAIRRHPDTGEATLYLSTPERCTKISGTGAQAGAEAIAALYRRSIKPEALYRHKWHTGDLVIWDDRTTMHRADHSAVCGDRVFHRGLVQGERPIAA